MPVLILRYFWTFSWVITSFCGRQNASLWIPGIYTMVYFGAIHLYCKFFPSISKRELIKVFLVTKKPANTSRLVILSTVSLLYLLCFGNFIFQWYFLDWSIIINGINRKSIFSSTEGGPPLIRVVSVFFSFSSIFVSDGLLVGIFIFYYTVYLKFQIDMEMLPRLGTIIPSNLCPSSIYCCWAR